VAARIKDLAALAALRDELNRAAREREAEAAATQRVAAAHQAAADDFRAMVGEVKPLAIKQRVEHERPPHPPIPKQRIEDNQQVLIESVSDEFEIDTLLHTDAELSFRRPGIGPDGASCAGAMGDQDHSTCMARATRRGTPRALPARGRQAWAALRAPCTARASAKGRYLLKGGPRLAGAAMGVIASASTSGRRRCGARSCAAAGAAPVNQGETVVFIVEAIAVLACATWVRRGATGHGPVGVYVVAFIPRLAAARQTCCRPSPVFLGRARAVSDHHPCADADRHTAAAVAHRIIPNPVRHRGRRRPLSIIGVALALDAACRRCRLDDGVVTGSLAVLRDVLLNEVPMVLRDGRPYAIAAFLAAGSIC
jgi:hypothetical protein